MVGAGCETRARWSIRGESSSDDDWKSPGGFAHNFVGRARRQPALRICFCGFSPGHQPTDERDRRWIVRHDLLCPGARLLPAFFVVHHRRKHTANRRLSHHCDVSCRNHVCRGRLARHHRQDRDDRCPWSTLRALNIPVGHQGKYVFAYLEPVMPPESIHTRAYIGHARDVAGDAEVTSTAEKSDWQGPAGTSSQFERARADALRQPHQMPLQ